VVTRVFFPSALEVIFILIYSKKRNLVHLEGETSNALFDELADWNEHLKNKNIDFRGPTP